MAAPREFGKGTNQEAIHRHNLGAVLRHVHRAGELSRSELGRATWLNRSTIADLTTALEASGIIERTLPVERLGKGRPSVGVRLTPTGPFVIAVELAVDRVTVARIGLGGRLDARAHTAIGRGTGVEEVGGIVAGLVRRVVVDAPATAPLVGIGIAVPGLVRRSDGLVRLAPNLEWHDVEVRSVLLAALGVDVPVVVANEADLGVLAERELGAGRGIDDLVYISGQVGVGAGVISGGHPLVGAGGYAGELGHLQFDPGGLPCHCGSTGCWETAVGGHAIATAVGCPPDEVGQLADHLRGPVEVTDELRRIGTDIGRGLASVVNAFNPQVVLLGGYFSSLYPHVRAEVAAGLAASALPAAVEQVRLAQPGLGDDSILFGAAEIALESLFVDPVGSMADALQDVSSRFAP